MLQRITVENFKCFAKESLELSGLNLFSGINSMGKSTLIQALLLVRQSYEQTALAKGLYLNGRYTAIGSGRDLLYTDAAEDSIVIELEDTKGNAMSLSYAYDAKTDFLPLDLSSYIDDHIENNLLDSGFTYIAADRLGPQSSYQKSYYEVWDKGQIGSHGEYAVHYLDAHAEDVVENGAVWQKGYGKHLLEQVEGWMSEITPGVRFRMEDYGHSNHLGLTASQESSNGANYFSAQNMGFGISYVLPVVLALVKAKEGDMLILENPEAHLHPRGQRKMGELIARAVQGGVQVIVETHSDHVLNGIRFCVKYHLIDPDLVRLYFFSRKEADSEMGKMILPLIERPVLMPDGRLSFWPEGFFDEWDKAIDELF